MKAEALIDVNEQHWKQCPIDWETMRTVDQGNLNRIANESSLHVQSKSDSPRTDTVKSWIM